MSREGDRWCPVEVDTLSTGEGVACGRYASVQREYRGRTVWVCPEHDALLTEDAKR